MGNKFRPTFRGKRRWGEKQPPAPPSYLLPTSTDTALWPPAELHRPLAGPSRRQRDAVSQGLIAPSPAEPTTATRAAFPLQPNHEENPVQEAAMTPESPGKSAPHGKVQADWLSATNWDVIGHLRKKVGDEKKQRPRGAKVEVRFRFRGCPEGARRRRCMLTL